MTLTERYLRAVAAQLPKATRDDIVAELADAIEARSEDLGRPLTEAETEAVLREMGHPLLVAGRYGSGPQHVVGPDLYPWWLFGLKVALGALVIITLIGVLARVLTGDAYVGEAIGRGFASLFSGAITVIGLATVAGFIIERQKARPAFLNTWRVRDLGLFELAGFDTEAVTRMAETAPVADKAASKPPAASRRMSPTAGALASAAAWAVVLLWWTGVLDIAGLRMGSFGPVSGGVDYGGLLGQTARLLYWPVIAYGAARILFGLARAAWPGRVRMTALGDLGLTAAWAGMLVWLWRASPLAPVIGTDSLDAFVERVRGVVETGDWNLSVVLMMIVAIALVGALFDLAGAATRLVTGRGRREDER